MSKSLMHVVQPYTTTSQFVTLLKKNIEIHIYDAEEWLRNPHHFFGWIVV